MSKTDSIKQAFAHPEARAKATPATALPDRISLRDYLAEADIGAFQQERGAPQRLRFNIVVEIRPHPAPLKDDVDLILSYDRLTEAIAAELASGRLNLLETLAEQVAARILAEPQALRCFVRIEKLDRGPGALGVEIMRARQESADPAMTDPAAPAPLVVFLDAATLAAADIAHRIEALKGRGHPLVLTVATPAHPRPQTGDATTQRRIDLLSIEQNAWALAARVPGLTVVATRTELDWALKQAQTTIWAPSKLVLDSPGSPDTADAATLALWLAQTLDAKALLLCAPAPQLPRQTRVAVEST